MKQPLLTSLGQTSLRQTSLRALLDVLRLRPYGDSLLTPAVRIWTGFAWVVIFLMASIEGIVWGLVGATMTPRDAAWLGPIAGLFMLVLMFAIVWILDASLVMSERPMVRVRRWSRGPNQGIGALLRWMLGLAMRIAIVAISLYVTAPFLAKLIRADDIAAHHQRQVESYFAQRSQRLQGLVAERTAQIRQSHREQAEPLEQDIERLTQELATERQKRAAIEAESAPEIAILRADLAAARQRTGDEILGRGGRPEGRGPEARKWEASANLLAAQLAEKEAQVKGRVAEIAERIERLEQSLSAQADRLQRLGEAQQSRLDQILKELQAEQTEALPPKLSFAARSKALQELRDSPEEHGVPHFETVEGFAQAALGVLFFSLIALKLFEPAAVRAYFSETAQMQYQKYLAGGLSDIPGFELSPVAERRCNPVEFVRLWNAYERDPAAFYTDRKALIEVREPLARLLAEQTLEHDRLVHRRESLEHEMLFVRRRREHEMIAYDRELGLRTAQLQAQLANETRALKDHRRIEIAAELQQARAEWHQRHSRAEEELRQLRDGFEQEQARARAELQLREREIERLREQSLAEVRQAEVSRQLAHARQLAEMRDARRREERKTRLNGMREELSRLRALEIKQRAERQTLRETARKLGETFAGAGSRVAELTHEIDAQKARAISLAQTLARHADENGEDKGARRAGFWGRADRVADGRTVREATRDLKVLEETERVQEERLARLREELDQWRLRKEAAESDLAEAEERSIATEQRIQFYEDGLSALLSASELDDQDGTETPEPRIET